MTTILIDHPYINNSCYLFSHPKQVIACYEPDQLTNCLRQIEQICQTENLFAAGYISYEAGLYFETGLEPLMPANRTVALLKFGLFDAPQLLNPDEVAQYYKHNIHGEFALTDINISESKADYIAKIERLKQYIAAGDIYQANYTFGVDMQFEGDLLGLYAALKQAQPTQLGGFLQFDDETILSLSPELFFNLSQNDLTARPMKGTAPRGQTPAQDAELKTWLHNDPKNRAENLMIVDLLRNDLSRVAEIGSVNVARLYDIETYDSLFQMTTSINALKRPNIGFPTLIKSLFPCGSVTGAPKIRAMEIIAELEDKPRGVYCGSIGFLTPNGDANFNVAIRTLTWLKNQADKLHLGIGSGIVTDSQPQQEYDECLLKMKFLNQALGDFELIESLLYDGDIAYLDMHLDRMCNSAKYFGFNFDRQKVSAQITAYCHQLGGQTSFKVKFLLDRAGNTHLSHIAIPSAASNKLYRVTMADIILDKNSIFARHKTTKRQLIDAARERAKLAARQTPIDEVLFANQDGYITEGSFTTIFAEINGIHYTPPLNAGLLNGVLRRYLLETLPDAFKVKNLKLADLEQADSLWLGNSVRGLVRAELMPNS
ncbi:MAG: aminodeoxychorismate synthase component I [Rhizobiales bacterium]|nr:aminodeoxychorismate synthase component I [Hyphomicrobiales bacterium]NRB15230.1 aminodeoxychorismate synthase component I [Hyphomicrobiales bacterium]